jgi:hypothetical protein
MNSGQRVDVLEGDRASKQFDAACQLRYTDVEDVVEPAEVRRPRQDLQVGADEPEIVTRARPKHHAMLAEPHWLRIAVGRDVPYGQEPHSVPGLTSSARP